MVDMAVGCCRVLLVDHQCEGHWMMTVFGPYIYLYIHSDYIKRYVHVYTKHVMHVLYSPNTVMTSSSKTTIRPMVSPTDCRNPHRKYLVCLRVKCSFRRQILPVLCVLEQL